MEYSKIKNIIIIILLIVNIFFLALFLIGRVESGKLEKQAKENIINILSSNGISLDISLIPEDSDLGYYKLTRDIDSEKLISDTLLGTKDITSVDGSTYQYENVLGKAAFKVDGEFQVTMSSNKELQDTSTKGLVSYLKGMNIAVDEKSAKTEITENRKTVVFTCAFNKTEISNGRIAIVLSGNSLVSISGRRPTAAPSKSESSIIGVKTALIDFINVKSLNSACNKISKIYAGYVISNSSIGSSELLPVWCFETNSGLYYVNGINGKISASFD